MNIYIFLFTSLLLFLPILICRINYTKKYYQYQSNSIIDSALDTRFDEAESPHLDNNEINLCKKIKVECKKHKNYRDFMRYLYSETPIDNVSISDVTMCKKARYL